MKPTQYKILAAAMALGTFTKRELTDRANVNFSTVSSWLERNPDFVRKTGDIRNAHKKGGRPAEVWKVRDPARDNIRQILKDLWGDQIQQLIQPQDAAAAFADTEARDRTRMHLYCAGLREDGESREAELENAKWWFAREERKHNRWTRHGFPPPPEVADEVRSLKHHLDGFGAKVDRLRFDVRAHTLASAAEWLSTSLNRWFSSQPNERSTPFAPLAFDKRKNLDTQLEVAISTVDVLAGIPKDRLILALVICLSRVDAGAARNALCNTLVRVGFDVVADSLRKQFSSTPVTGESFNLLHVFAGLGEFPRMVAENDVGTWVDSLAYSSLLSDRLTPFYINLLQHRPHAILGRIIEEKSNSLNRLIRDVGSNPLYWTNYISGLRQDHVRVFEQVGRWQDEYPAMLQAPADEREAEIDSSTGLLSRLVSRVPRPASVSLQT